MIPSGQPRKQEQHENETGRPMLFQCRSNAVSSILPLYVYIYPVILYRPRVLG